MSDFDIISSDEYVKRQSGLSRKYSIFLVVVDPERSEIAKIIGIKVPGSYYAVKPR
jgi:RNA polymerase subunit RPABC4/transcription elongation factor Spt4